MFTAHFPLPIADNAVQEFVHGHAGDFRGKGDYCGVWITFASHISFALLPVVFSWISPAQILFPSEFAVDGIAT